MGVDLSENVLANIKQVARNIHHGRIVVDINADRPDMVELRVEYCERFPVESKKISK
jgi:hypothetical protein